MLCGVPLVSCRSITYVARVLVVAVLLGATGCGETDQGADSTSKADGREEVATVGSGKVRAELEATPTCPEDDVGELERVRDFVAGESWTSRRVTYSLHADTRRCVMVLSSDELNEEEEAELRRGASDFLRIERKSVKRTSNE